MNRVTETCSSEIERAMIVDRRALHRRAELGGEETSTQAYLLGVLDSLGIRAKKLGTGIVADVRGASRGRVAFRADMDALPIRECPKEYESECPGVSHMCGHDGHMAILLGLARHLSVRRPPIDVRLIFQPSEERGGGAEKLIEQGVLDSVDLIFGLHLSAELPLGAVATVGGALFAGNVDFRIEFEGKSAHVAEADRARDALRAAVAFYERTDALYRAAYERTCLYRLCSLNAGAAHNVIADRATVLGSFRYYDEPRKEAFVMALERELIRIREEFGVDHRFVSLAAYPPLRNSVPLTDRISAELGLSEAKPRYTAEDFSFYLQYVDGMFAWLGGGTERFCAPLHSPAFDFDERALAVGLNTELAILDLVARGVV